MQGTNTSESSNHLTARPPLNRWQTEGRRQCNGARAFAYLMPMGCGKTRTLIEDACDLRASGLIDVLIVAAPGGVTRQWCDLELPRWMRVPYEAVLWRPASSHTKAWKAHASATLNARDKLAVLVVNYEAFTTTSLCDLVAQILKRRRCMFALDESTKIKNHKAERTKSILQLARGAHYRRILTGTPVTRGVENLYSQFKFLDPGIFGKSVVAFRNRYCTTEPVWGAPRGVVKITGYQNLEELVTRLRTCSYLPDKAGPEGVVSTHRAVALTDQQRKLHALVARGLQEELEAERIDVNGALARITKLQQICCGHYTDADGVCVDVQSRRAADCADVLEECSGQTIIWHRYVRDAQLMGAELARRGVPHVAYSGQVERKQRERDYDRFLRGDVPVLLAQLQSFSHGFDCPNVQTSIFYSYGHDWEQYEQARGRQRPGMVHSGVYVTCVAPQSIEESIVETLELRRSTAEMIADLMKRGIRT